MFLLPWVLNLKNTFCFNKYYLILKQKVPGQSLTLLVKGSQEEMNERLQTAAACLSGHYWARYYSD